MDKGRCENMTKIAIISEGKVIKFTDYIEAEKELLKQ